MNRRRVKDMDPESRARELCIPRSFPPETKFADIIEAEYECMKDATQLARETRAEWRDFKLHASPTDPRCKYRRKLLEVKPQVHSNKFKLFLSDLKFLTEFVNPDKRYICVHIDCEGDQYIEYLSQLFPNVVFNVYTTQPISPERVHVKNIYLNFGKDSKFTRETAMVYKNNSEFYQRDNYDLLLISRFQTDRGNMSKANARNTDSICARDMEMQYEWMEIMKPRAAMFGFHLPYSPGKTIWLAPHSDRHLTYNPFSTKAAVEMCLVSTDSRRMLEYDHTEMEERSFYFNSFTRNCQYGAELKNLKEHPLKKSLNMDDCWDCTAARKICLGFLSKKYESMYGETREVMEVIRAAVMDILPMPSEVANIIAKYATCIDETELYSFIAAIIKYASQNVISKLSRGPHGSSTKGTQWIDRFEEFRGNILYSKNTMNSVSPAVCAEIEKLYAQSGKHSPPLCRWIK